MVFYILIAEIPFGSLCILDKNLMLFIIPIKKGFIKNPVLFYMRKHF